jgi:hypothetical protein
MKAKLEKTNICLFILNTSLFYPALLGTIFYLLLEDFNSIANDNIRILYVISALGIIISFSVDFLYTYASKSIYNWKLFTFDILIILLLFLSYKTLINSLKYSEPIKPFFTYFILIHAIFIVWDLLIVPENRKSKKIIIFDFFGFILTLLGLIWFSNYPLYGVIFLWIFAVFYIFLGFNEVSKLVLKEEK